jgi:Flp pilus assembly protein TadG
MPILRTGRAGRARGQALVEFALVIPIFILILLAVFDLGRLILVSNSLTNAAREGARLAIVNQDKSLVLSRVQAMAFGGGVSNSGNLNDLVSFYKQLPNNDPTTNAQCSSMAVGCVAVVTVRSTWSAITPIIGSVVGPINLVSRSELPVELVCPNPDVTAYLTSASCPRQP